MPTARETSLYLVLEIEPKATWIHNHIWLLELQPHVMLNARPNTNHLITYCQPVCYYLKNTTIPCKEYLQYPVNSTYNIINKIISCLYKMFLLSL